MGKEDQKIVKKERNDGVIFIGQKPLRNYVNAVAIQFSVRNQSIVRIIARGKFTSKAIDVAEISKKKFLGRENKIKIKDGGISISSESFEKKEGKEIRKLNVSLIQIILEKIK